MVTVVLIVLLVDNHLIVLIVLTFKQQLFINIYAQFFPTNAMQYGVLLKQKWFAKQLIYKRFLRIEFIGNDSIIVVVYICYKYCTPTLYQLMVSIKDCILLVFDSMEQKHG